MRNRLVVSPVKAMVKAVVGEETQLNEAEDRLARSAIPAQVFSLTFSLPKHTPSSFIALRI